MQNWTPNFDLSNPKGILVPTWVTLRRVPDEFQSVVRQIAQGLEEVLGGDRNNSTMDDQRFYLALPAGDGWEPTVTVTNASTRASSTIIIDYINLPIRCRFCLETDHRVKDCPGLNFNKQKDIPPALTSGTQAPSLSIPSQGLPPPPPSSPPTGATKIASQPPPAQDQAPKTQAPKTGATTSAPDSVAKTPAPAIVKPSNPAGVCNPVEQTKSQTQPASTETA